MILFPFYDINLDLENVRYKDASWDISLVWRMCLPQRKDTQFQLRCFSCSLLAVTVFPEASVRFSLLDSICSRLCNPPHLPPFVREVQLFFSGESRGVFNTQSHSLPWFYFSLLCILFLINPVLQNEIGVRTWEWPDLKISLFFLSFLLLMTLIHPGILEVAAAGCSNVFFCIFLFCFSFFLHVWDLKDSTSASLVLYLLSKTILSGLLQGIPQLLSEVQPVSFWEKLPLFKYSWDVQGWCQGCAHPHNMTAEDHRHFWGHLWLTLERNPQKPWL